MKKKPSTLEEALQIISELETKVETVIQEKKDVLQMFDQEELDGMDSATKKMAAMLQEEREARIKAETEAKENAARYETERKEAIQRSIDSRINKASKGDKEFAEKLKEKIGLLEKMPRITDEDLDNLVDSAYKLTGQTAPNPLHNNTPGGTEPNIDATKKDDFLKTKEGIEAAEAFGISKEDLDVK